MKESTFNRFFTQAKTGKQTLKVFLEGESRDAKKTMLTGVITDFDEEDIVLGECLIPRNRIISATPFR